jgi:hypothetical protein
MNAHLKIMQSIATLFRVKSGSPVETHHNDCDLPLVFLESLQKRPKATPSRRKQLAVTYAGLTVLVIVALFASLYWYSIFLLNSALSFGPFHA